MYGSKEIKIALRKYIASTGNKTIDEQSVIDILDEGADRDFDKASQIVKEIRQQYKNNSVIPEWLRMLAFRLVYDYMTIEYTKKMEYDNEPENKKKRKVYKVLSQNKLIEAIGFNKKVFDKTSSWNIYSPYAKWQQSQYNALNIPVAYAEIVSNPIYVAMLHHIISESRVVTDTFVDIFGKMGYVSAVCANGYAHNIFYTQDADTYKRYYDGMTKNPNCTYEFIYNYGERAKQFLDEPSEKTGRDRLDEFEAKFYDYQSIRLLCGIPELEVSIKKAKNDEGEELEKSQEQLEEEEKIYNSKYAALRFITLCYQTPYWKKNNIKYDKLSGEYVEKFSSLKQIKKVFDITEDSFVAYANALKKTEYREYEDNLLVDLMTNYNNIKGENDVKDIVKNIFKLLGIDEKALLFVDIPKYNEYYRYGFDTEILEKEVDGKKRSWLSDEEKDTTQEREDSIINFLLDYDGDWVMTLKGYSFGNTDANKHYNDIIRKMRESHRNCYIYKCSNEDHNISTAISFITSINFDELSADEFKAKYNIEVSSDRNETETNKYRLSKLFI